MSKTGENIKPSTCTEVLPKRIEEFKNRLQAHGKNLESEKMAWESVKIRTKRDNMPYKNFGRNFVGAMYNSSKGMLSPEGRPYSRIYCKDKSVAQVSREIEEYIEHLEKKIRQNAAELASFDEIYYCFSRQFIMLCKELRLALESKTGNSRSILYSEFIHELTLEAGFVQLAKEDADETGL